MPAGVEGRSIKPFLLRNAGVDGLDDEAAASSTLDLNSRRLR